MSDVQEQIALLKYQLNEAKAKYTKAFADDKPLGFLRDILWEIRQLEKKLLLLGSSDGPKFSA